MRRREYIADQLARMQQRVETQAEEEGARAELLRRRLRYERQFGWGWLPGKVTATYTGDEHLGI